MSAAITYSSISLRGFPPISLEGARANLDAFSVGRRITAEPLVKMSPEEISGDPLEQAKQFLLSNFQLDDFVNIVREAGGRNEGKLGPKGSGMTFTCDQWIRTMNDSFLESGPGGIWVRFNPVQKTGSGKAGAYCDRDVTAYRHVLVESDGLSLDEQATLLAHLRLPIISIVSTGQRSLHALVRMPAANEAAYKANARQLFRMLRIFGVDCSNSNPSRMTRLPGALRPTGEGKAARQELVYLDPAASGKPILEVTV